MGRGGVQICKRRFDDFDDWFDIKSHLKQVASNLATFIKNTEQKPNMNELCTSCRETISLCYKVTFRRVCWQK